jgi:S-adenosylmethionine:tRNA ribosyltransferase-isomerase
VAAAGSLHHAVFRDLPMFLRPGDLLVVNTSGTLAAALDARREDGTRIVLHASTWLDAGTWIVELRASDGSGPVLDGVAGETVAVAGGARVTLLEPDGARNRLWRARVDVDGTFAAHLRRWGRPITYGYAMGRRPLAEYQTVFAREPGSAEMPSAARPFTARLVTDLVAHGVTFAPLVLHCGVSSPEAGEPPQPERYRVPHSTAALVNGARAAGGRIVAVGTTATRAIETVAAEDGTVRAGEGWTDVVIGPDRTPRVVEGLITGWHAPEASHLLLLEAAAGAGLVAEAYGAALEARYRWHEFGDSCLLLAEPSDRSARP